MIGVGLGKKFSPGFSRWARFGSGLKFGFDWPVSPALEHARSTHDRHAEGRDKLKVAVSDFGENVFLYLLLLFSGVGDPRANPEANRP